MQFTAINSYSLFQATLYRYLFIDLLLFEHLFFTLSSEVIRTHFIGFYCFLSSMLFSLSILMLDCYFPNILETGFYFYCKAAMLKICYSYILTLSYNYCTFILFSCNRVVSLTNFSNNFSFSLVK